LSTWGGFSGETGDFGPNVAIVAVQPSPRMTRDFDERALIAAAWQRAEILLR
jgi:hypothetical protein